ncbi:MAG: DUF2335 domain-containing protein [Gammaproteobacteria bacterium]
MTEKMARPYHGKSKRANQASSTQNQNSTVAVAQRWIGPLPPPNVIEQFNDIVPNGAERIFKMAEIEQAHRIATEDASLKASVSEARRGQYLGAGISIIALAFSLISVFIGANPFVSVALVGVPLMGLVEAIVSNRSRK